MAEEAVQRAKRKATRDTDTYVATYAAASTSRPIAPASPELRSAGLVSAYFYQHG
ncbi:unnamed protein product [Ectocarpus fasciculatus]